MSIDKVERLANLVAALLHSARPMALREIVAEVEGYPKDRASAETARVAFERDKRELRDEGVDIEIVDPPPGSDSDEPRYRIDPATYYLPDLGLTAQETVALNIALSAVQVEGIDPESARWKLGPGPVAEVVAGSRGLVRLTAPPMLPRLHDAIVRRCPVSFTYGGVARSVEPWGLLSRDGFWYLIGHDRLRGAERNFRVDRIGDELVVDSAGAGAFDPPAGFRPDAAVPDEPWQLGPGEAVTATVVIDAAMADRVEAEVEPAAVRERRADGSIAISLEVTNPDGLQSWLFGLLDHAVVLEPASLREAIVARLTTMAGR